jgi:hypothetical protein
LAILYVSATSETIRDRAMKRAEKTGRAVPEDLLQASIDQVPASVAALAPLTDVTFEISNNDGKPMELKRPVGGDAAPTWDNFRMAWSPDDEEEEKESGGNKKVASSEPPPVMHCEMMASYDDTNEHKAANSIWKKSYPSFCARCTLACDGQCGLCIHDRHICACEICNSSASECPAP